MLDDGSKTQSDFATNIRRPISTVAEGIFIPGNYRVPPVSQYAVRVQTPQVSLIISDQMFGWIDKAVTAGRCVAEETMHRPLPPLFPMNCYIR
mmetsp:Transcript_30709/g.55715  ORF Transcript_30709/g.55715 Transcript_30709/m.55715 type:complete len:93 (+) Transcript_30709:128-406(+)